MTQSLSSQDIEQLVAFSRDTLGEELNEQAKYDSDELYHSLPLCVVDAVFSIGVKYESTRAVVKRLAEHQGWSLVRGDGGEEIPLSALVALYDQYDADEMANEVYQNRQRTSTKNGLLKSEAVLLFAKALQECGIEYVADVAAAKLHHIEAFVTQIPGQRSGVSLRYFYMLTGDYNHVKPDRYVMHFVTTALKGRTVSVKEYNDMLVETCRVLQTEYPHLKPRTLDSRIWWWGRAQKGI